MNKLVYDDRQIRQAEITHVRIDAPMVITGAAKIGVHTQTWSAQKMTGGRLFLPLLW
jgi:hypothetical protein